MQAIFLLIGLYTGTYSFKLCCLSYKLNNDSKQMEDNIKLELCNLVSFDFVRTFFFNSPEFCLPSVVDSLPAVLSRGYLDTDRSWTQPRVSWAAIRWKPLEVDEQGVYVSKGREQKRWSRPFWDEKSSAMVNWSYSRELLDKRVRVEDKCRMKAPGNY